MRTFGWHKRCTGVSQKGWSVCPDVNWKGLCSFSVLDTSWFHIFQYIVDFGIKQSKIGEVCQVMVTKSSNFMTCWWETTWVLWEIHEFKTLILFLSAKSFYMVNMSSKPIDDRLICLIIKSSQCSTCVWSKDRTEVFVSSYITLIITML